MVVILIICHVAAHFQFPFRLQQLGASQTGKDS